MMWGKVKSDEWVTSLLLSFFSDNFFTKPAKIVTLAVLYALVVKLNTEESEAQTMINAQPLGRR